MPYGQPRPPILGYGGKCKRELKDLNWGWEKENLGYS